MYATRMRFKKGSRVEVLRKSEISSGSWYLAEIIHGNGHYYTVKYEGALNEAICERVPRKAIRPCPPLMQITKDWAVGDMVEVFYHFSWMTATVMGMLRCEDLLLVRLVRSAGELKVSKLDVRPRLHWQDDEWKVVNKTSIMHEGQDAPSTLDCNHSSKLTGPRTSIVFKARYSPTSNFNSIHDSQAFVSRSMKQKRSNCNSPIEEYARPSKKVKNGIRKRPFISSQCRALPEKVVAIASTQKTLVEKSMLPSFNRLFGYSKTTLERERMDGAVRCSFGVSLDSDDVGSITSSVASCSSSANNGYSIPHRFPRENDDYDSDAESTCGLGLEEGHSLLPAGEKLAEEIHRLELHAYHRIMEALYVAGPLSWEQETLLTNLRDSLHISIDEHLRVLRTLISSRPCTPVSS